MRAKEESYPEVDVLDQDGDTRGFSGFGVC
jgi:hypothetical protein